MIPLVLILLPFFGGAVAWAGARRGPLWPRVVSLITVAAGFGLVVAVWVSRTAPTPGERWIAELRFPWVASFGIDFHLGLDGLSLLMLALTYFLGMVAVLVSWLEGHERPGLFHFALLWVLAATAGVFLAIDLFLFYFFWELMLVPMYLLIGLWGRERRAYAAIKFFIYTQAGGLFLLVAILGLVFAHRAATGVLTFDYDALLGTVLGPVLAAWLLLGFLAAFLVKLPAVPLHGWLPDALAETPIAAGVVLAALLPKTAAYGLLRFAVPLFPDAAARFGPALMALGAAGVLYGASVALAQTDLRRFLAYASISHLGFILLGVFAWNGIALQGVVMQILAHGVAIGALFVLIGLLAVRLHIFDLDGMGGLWSTAPRLGGLAMVFALALLGLPGLGNFVAEFLTLIGSFRAQAPIAIAAAVGLILATIYALWLIQRAFHGEARPALTVPDLRPREAGFVLAMVVVLLWLGIYPQIVLDTAAPALEGLRAISPMMGR